MNHPTSCTLDLDFAHLTVGMADSIASLPQHERKAIALKGEPDYSRPAGRMGWANICEALGNCHPQYIRQIAAILIDAYEDEYEPDHAEIGRMVCEVVDNYLTSLTEH